MLYFGGGIFVAATLELLILETFIWGITLAVELVCIPMVVFIEKSYPDGVTFSGTRGGLITLVLYWVFVCLG